MKTISSAALIAALALGCGNDSGEDEKSSSRAPAEETKSYEITDQDAAGQSMPGGLIARVKVDAQGNPVGPIETREIEGDFDASNQNAVISAFGQGKQVEAEMVDGGDRSTESHWTGRRGRQYRRWVRRQSPWYLGKWAGRGVWWGTNPYGWIYEQQGRAYVRGYGAYQGHYHNGPYISGGFQYACYQARGWSYWRHGFAF